MSRAARRRSSTSSGSSSATTWTQRLATVVLVLLSALFSFLNAGERVSVNLGVATIYQISFVGLVFAAFILGMLTMFLFGIRQDRQIRDVLRDEERSVARRRSPAPVSPPPLTPEDSEM